MVNRLTTAAAWLNSKLQSHASDACLLIRSSGTPIEITPTPGQSVFDVDAYEHGGTVRMETRDFIIDLAQLLDAGKTYYPKAGDKIQIPSLDSTYEVFSPDGGNAWRYSSAAEKSIRVHTKRK